MANYESGIVGGTARLSTWGKFRVTLARNARDVVSNTSFNLEYGSGLKCDGDGSGWIRKAPPDYSRSGSIEWQPCFFAGTYYPPPTEEDPDPDPIGEVVLRRGQSSLYPPLSDEFVDYLTGGTIFSDGGDATMDSTFWGNNSSATVPAPATTIDSVDGLTDF
jgi:hypothetical protein